MGFRSGSDLFFGAQVGFRSGFCGSGWVKVQVQVLFLGFRLDQGLAFGVLVRLKLGSGLIQVWYLGSGWV